MNKTTNITLAGRHGTSTVLENLVQYNKSNNIEHFAKKKHIKTKRYAGGRRKEITANLYVYREKDRGRGITKPVS